MSGSAVLGFTLLLISMTFLGSWPAILRLCSTSTSVFGFATKPLDQRFAYLDFALSYVVSSSVPLLFALTKESITSDKSSEEKDSRWDLVFCAFLGGCMLSFGNMSMQWATAVFGAPLTTVVAIQASMTVLLGTSINFLLEPQMTSRPEFLMAGVLAFLAAIGLATRAHLLYGQEKDQPTIEGIELGQVVRHHRNSYGSLESDDSLEKTSSLKAIDKSSTLLVSGDNFSEMENQVSTVHSSKTALLVSVLGGCCLGFFSPAFNIAVNDPFNSSDEASPLSVPVANLWFSFAFTLGSFGGNIPIMYNPPRQFGLDKTSLSEYCNESSPTRKLAAFAGFLCGSANLLQFQGGSLVGFATADLVQAFPLIASVWDIVLFGEFRYARGTVIYYLVAMYALYLCGIGLLLSSAAL